MTSVQKEEGQAFIRDFKLDDLEDTINVVESSFTREFALTGFDHDRVRKMARRMYGRKARIFLGFLAALGRPPFRFYVAQSGEHVVGTTMVSIERTHGYMANVAVHPSFRRLGLARAMLERAILFAGERSRRKAVLHVISDNTAARTLYESMGFQPFEKLIWAITRIRNPLEASAGIPVNVRKYTNADRDALFELIRNTQPQATAEVLGLDRRDLATSPFMRLFRLASSARWVAMKDGRIVGTIKLSWGGMTNTPSLTEHYIATQERGQPLEAALLDTAIKGVTGLGADRFVMQFNAERQDIVGKLEAMGRTETLLLDGMVKQID